MRTWLCGLAFVMLACQTPTASGPSSAGDELMTDEEIQGADVPDLTGEWTGNIRAIYSGDEGPHAYDVVEEGVNIDSLRFTMNIEFQERRLFFGTVASTSAAERFVGAIRSDGEVAVYSTNRGSGVMHLLSADKIESCHTHGTEQSMFATCDFLTRAK